ncbi:hypothetical protein EV361DRAFT_655549 [Lentinula raphanica]|nr:hypothetical protein EV361DRAFT_655549 [Lentinula raphanica]
MVKWFCAVGCASGFLRPSNFTRFRPHASSEIWWFFTRFCNRDLKKFWSFLPDFCLWRIRPLSWFSGVLIHCSLIQADTGFKPIRDTLDDDPHQPLPAPTSLHLKYMQIQLPVTLPYAPVTPALFPIPIVARVTVKRDESTACKNATNNF